MLMESLKEQFKARLRLNDPTYRYYKTIFNATTDMIALTDGERFIDANTSMIHFCESMRKTIFSNDFRFSNFFEPIERFGYIYEGYKNKRWYELALEYSDEGCCVGIMKDDEMHSRL